MNEALHYKKIHKMFGEVFVLLVLLVVHTTFSGVKKLI